jgi:hypothetical protein
MGKNIESQLSQIDDLLNEVERSTSGKRLFVEIDDLCGEIEAGFNGRKQEITEWPVEQKRKEAADSDDLFVLNLLSMDESLVIRTLSACNSNIPENSLRRLVEGANDYVRMVIANNPNSTPDILDRIAELSSEQEVLDAVRGNKNVSAVTKFKIENRM